MLIEDAPERAAALAPALAAARTILSLIESTLSPAASSVGASQIESMQAAMATHQQAIVRAVAEVRQSGPDASAAADLDRIEEAARRLTPSPASGHVAIAGTAADAPTLMVELPTMLSAAPAPPRASRPRTAPAAAAAAQAPARPFHILVVDDVAENRDVLQRRLEREGHAVSCAANGREALERTGAQAFDLILLDILMPEVDGFEVLRRLKQSEDTRDIPVIMISALDDLDSVVRCIEQGAEDHLTKPFDPVLLRARINASLDKKRLRDREREYLDEVKAIAQAAGAVEDGRYEPASLARTALRPDELGRLARVFDGMAAEVKAREDRLRREVSGLRREIEHARRMAASARRQGTADEEGDRRLPLGHVLGNRYEVRELAGAGAMGTVYRVHDRELGEDVALKVLRPDMLSDPDVIERFKAEVRLARKISHPSVVRTHDFGEADGVHFLTMEYVEGLTARALLDDRGRLPADSALALGRQLAEALAAAHAQGVIHRDIKPQNLLLDGQGVLKVMDFGVSRLSDQGGSDLGMLVGTPAYMPPEQLLGEDIDSRADLYAVGVVLFECLTGRLPFVADTLVALVAKVLHEDPPAPADLQPDVPVALSALVCRLLSRARDERPASAHDLLRAINQISA
jgi:CheY-like chemotaxis protein